MEYKTLDSILAVTLYGGLAASGFALQATGSIPGAALTIDMFQSLQVTPSIWRESKNIVHSMYDWCSEWRVWPPVAGYPYI